MLPLEEALKLVSRFVRQEMRLRVALVSGDAMAATPLPGVATNSTGAKKFVMLWVCSEVVVQAIEEQE